jgi:hypothetical protein
LIVFDCYYTWWATFDFIHVAIIDLCQIISLKDNLIFICYRVYFGILLYFTLTEETRVTLLPFNVVLIIALPSGIIRKALEHCFSGQCRWHKQPIIELPSQSPLLLLYTSFDFSTATLMLRGKVYFNAKPVSILDF